MVTMGVVSATSTHVDDWWITLLVGTLVQIVYAALQMVNNTARKGKYSTNDTSSTYSILLDTMG